MAPGWFVALADQSWRQHVLDVGDVAVRAAEWGPAEAPPLLCVHGGAAHKLWWEAVALSLAGRWRILAVDLSGHGDSDRRERYTQEEWLDELSAWIDLLGRRPVLVGHSMGGLVATQMAHVHGERLAGLVVLDSALTAGPPDARAERRSRLFRRPLTYPTREMAVERFQLMPRQPVVTPWLVRRVAEASVRPVGDRWTWAYDPAVFATLGHRPVATYAAALGCPTVLVRGELSRLVSPDDLVEQARLTGAVASRTVSGAHHHVLLDRPRELAALLDDEADRWRSTTGAKGES